KIIRDYDEDIPPVRCNKGKLQQVFLNLIKNGTYAMMNNSEDNPPEFKIRIKKGEEFITVKIRDNGSGIDEDNIKRIFEPFFTTKSVGEGTGLGLSISYFIITEIHNGIMKVNSNKDRGTTFTIKLPYN
ncbi:MAG TPA: HAMP domain-containing sensor histidine kinase, partial [Candidatus Mcinerneyibacterium sp.]|nr:HAMP domain-containing sensor histidine kinase [Candidatus Mcinerneyibacterium sp.]